MKIEIITTGGTIDKVYFDQKSEFQVGEPMVMDVLKEANVFIDFQVVSLIKKDSLDMNEQDRQKIFDHIEASPLRHFVLTHGTDTMVETARILKGIPNKVMVLTGAMQPAKFKFSDAVYNIATALTAVQLLDSGVYIAMNGTIFDPDKTKKNIAQNRFESIE